MLEHTIGFGGGKIILLGEHTVVHGTPAIAAGLGRGVTSIARSAPEDLLHIEPWGRSLRPSDDDPLARAFSKVLDDVGKRPPLRVDVRVDLPPGAGLGCSAAIGVSLLDAVDKALGIGRSRADIGARALDWERFFHGAPSGVDNTVSALGGLIRFQRSATVRSIPLTRPLHVVVAHSGERSSTKEMVARVSTRLSERPDWATKTLDEVCALVLDAELALRGGDWPRLGWALDRKQEILQSFGLSTPRLESLCELARSTGAHGAKVTGAGGGGCIIALAEDGHHAARIADALDADAFVEEIPHAA